MALETTLQRIPDLAEALHGWHDFYMLAGGAAATLVGLVFIAISIGTGYYADRDAAGLNTFITPTIVHFGGVMLFCLLAVVPNHTYRSLGLLLGAGGLVGFAYATSVGIRILRQFNTSDVETVDRVYYLATPIVSYILIIAAAALLLLHLEIALPMMAVGLIALMVAGIRNAWDMMVWIVLKSAKERKD